MFHSATQDDYQINVPSSFENYKIIKELGNGSTCVTVLVENQDTSQEYAAKIISKKNIIGNRYYQSIINEYKILNRISHQNIIKFIEMLEITNDEDEEFIIFIIEYCSNGDLLTYISENDVDEKTKKRIIHEMLSAIKYLHENEISHGDIKVENILLDSELHAKLCDFGYCRTSVIAGDDSKSGTLYYAAPELFLPFISFNTLKSDIYAIGITIYAIFELCFPFKDGDQACIIKQILSGEFSTSKKMNKQFQTLFEQCTNKQASLRPTIDQIINDELFSNKNESETTNENTELILNEVEV